MAATPSSPTRSSRILTFPKGTFYIQSGIANLVLDVESGFLKDPMKAGGRVELAHRKSLKSSTESFPQLEQQLWRAEEGYIVNVRALRAGSRVIQNVRKSGKESAGQQWLNDDGVLALASNPKLVVTIDGDASRDGTKITIQEKKAYNEKQKWSYTANGDSRPASPSPSRAESISIRPDNFPSSWFYIKSAASGLVVDIEHGVFTDPMKAGARAEMNHQKIDNGDGRHSLLELQLWRYEAGFLINRRTGFVLDIQGGTLKLAARVVQSQRTTGREARNQHWFYENGFIANVYNSRLVLDIDGDGSKDGAKIAIGERKATANADQQWTLEEVRYQWLATPGTPIVEGVPRGLPAPLPATTSVLPTNGWFYIRSLSSGHVIDVEQGLLSDSMSPNALVNMNAQITTSADSDHSKIESQLWRYDNGQLINRRSGLVLDCKQGVVRYGARLMQGIPKQGKEGHHQRWESVNGTLIIQGKPTFAIDIEGDGSKAGARLSLQRPKSQNNLDQQWEFQLANFEWLQYDRVVTRTVVEKTVVSSKSAPIQKDDWFFIKSSATSLVMDLEAGWITSPTDVGAYISMKKQRALDDADKSLLERQLWRFEDGYFINRKTGYVIDIYGRTAVVGVKLIQQHRALAEEEGQRNQLWNVVDGNIQLLYQPKFVINVESNRDGSRVQLVEHKSSSSSSGTWTLELARVMTRSSTFEESLEEAQVSVHTEFLSDKWFYIKSKASGLVLDVEHGFFRDHTKPGAYLELNGQKLFASAKRHALLELQLWRFESGFIINRRTGLVLDASEGILKPGARLIQWTRKTENNANQQWAVSNGFIHLKSQPNLVLDVDGDGTRDGARISLNERKVKKNLDQRWSFEAVHFTWLSFERTIESAEDDLELLKEYETTHLARVVEHHSAPTDCWFYLKSGISDLVLEVAHGRGVNHLKSGTHVYLGHQKLKSGKHSHALLELQLWRFQDGYIINRRSGLVLAVDKVESDAKLVQSTRTNAETHRWTIEDGVIRLAARKEFALFLSYGHQGAYAFIRQVRRGELLQIWTFSEVHFSWLTLEQSTSEQIEEEQLDVINESDVTYLKKEKVQLRRLERFSSVTYFFIRASNGYVVDIEHGFSKNHMRVGAYATVHPQTTAASASQHALLDIQLWTLKDGYLINKRTGLALTIENDAKEGAPLIQALPKNSIKWTVENGHIFPEQHSHLAINIRDGHVVLVERTTAITWSVYEVTLSWLIFTEVELVEVEHSEDFEFYEEFEEVVMRSSASSNEIIEYAKTEQHLIAPVNAWFYLVVGNKVAAISTTHLLERGAEGASIHLTVQKRFTSAERHALAELQLWKLENSYLINRFTGLYLTVDSSNNLVLAKKQPDASRQQWQFSKDGSLSLISNSSYAVDFANDKAILVERSSSKTIWQYDTIKFSWLTTMETSESYDVTLIEREITEYKTIYTRYIQYLTRYTITTTTTITRTRRVIRVHSQSPLQDATVLECDGTVWACHLVEAGTGVDYVMQLLHDNTKDVYYIYVQWGSTEGQLEGPYESVEIATKEFQEIFSSKIGIEWSERETAISSGEQWSAVEFEYDTVAIEEEHSGIDVTKSTSSSGSHIIVESSTHTMVDHICPIANEVVVHKDTDVYHTVLTQRSTGIIYTIQLLSSTITKTYYIYLRWGDSEYILDGPYDNVDTAKTQFKIKFKETFGVTWENRNTTSAEWAVVYRTLNIDDEYLSDLDDEEQAQADTTTTLAPKDTKVTTGGDKSVAIVRTTDTSVDDQATKEIINVTETSNITLTITKPAVTKKTSWFRRVATGAGVAAAGALTQVDGIWKRKTQVINTRKAAVDQICPIANTSCVYFDEDVYDAVVVERSTGTSYVTQLIYDTKTESYYVHYRWSEANYTLNGPYNTIEEAKQVYQVTYRDAFGIEWKEREVAVSDKWTYEFKTYETYETIEEVEEEVDQEEAVTFSAHERQIQIDENTKKTEVNTTTINDNVVIETVNDVFVTVDEKVQSKETIIAKTEAEAEAVAVESTVERIIEGVKEQKSVVVTKSTGIIAHPAITKATSWFRKIATGAGIAAAGALTHADGVWKRTVKVINARKGYVDDVCPRAKHSFVYYDDEVYDSVITDKSTGTTYVTQLIYDIETRSYYVYYRWNETDYKLEGPHDNVDSAKQAFKINYKEKFDIEWAERETSISDRYTYQVKTYETIEEVEEVEEIIDAEEAETIIARGEVGVIVDDAIRTDTSIKTSANKETAADEQTITAEVVVDKTKQEEDIKETIVVKETGVVAEPAVSKETSWLRRLASGAGAAAAGALTQADGVWKRTVQVLTTQKAHVDPVNPLAKTSYVYYDDEVYDSVLIERNSGLTHYMQLIYDSHSKAFYVFNRWGVNDYKLDGPYDTIEVAKARFHLIYKEWYGLEWKERETAVSERWNYQVRTYEAFQDVEEVEEIVEDYEVSKLIAREQQFIVDGNVQSTRQSIISTHDDAEIHTVSEKTLLQERGATADSQILSQAQHASLSCIEGAGAAGAADGFGSSSTVVVEETKKTVFDFASLPQLGNVGINADTGAADGVIDLRSGTAETLRELPAHLRPRAWVSLHVGGWQDAPHELEGFMRLDDQSGQRLMEHARDAADGKAQEATPIDNLRLPEIVALFAQKLYRHFGEELPEELSLERLSTLGPHRR
ncbi:hypothetical protein EDD11_010109 [Mortierella claussenii]|nr:hypothetical protein EDD11_010109 [Mortierella claussenii]